MTSPVHSVPPQVSVVLPTYNEALTLPVIVPRILKTLQDADLQAEIIVVDDHSPDHTADVARELASRWPVQVIERTGERGLATAVLAGFARSTAEVCVVMDADGSHPVDVLPSMVGQILSDKADLVVGSRHIPGGGTRNWSVFSQVKSRLAAGLAVGVTTMSDPTTGFMAVRRERLKTLKLSPVGWKIVLEIAVKAAPARISEVPILFSDRELGESKQSLFVFGQYLQHLAQLYAFRFPGLAQFVRFCLVGFSGVFVDLATVIGLKEWLDLDPRLCAVFGFAVAVSSNFLLNRKWTFRRSDAAPGLASYLTFVAASLVGLVVRLAVVHGLMVLAVFEQGYGYVLNNLVGIGFATFVNFLGAKFFAFAPERWQLPAEERLTTPARPAALPAFFAAGLTWSVLGAFALTQALRSGAHSAPEMRLLTMAQNMIHDSVFLLRPSAVPGGSGQWLQQDLPGLTHPPLFPAVVAAAVRVAGSFGPTTVTVGCLALTTVALKHLMSTVRPATGQLAALLLLGSPAFLHMFGAVQTETLTTALGMAGLWALSAGLRDARTARSALGGFLLGLAFSNQLWVSTPFFLAAAALMLVQRGATELPVDRFRRQLMHVLGATALGAGWHLLLVGIASPADLSPWLDMVYFGVFTGHGAVAQKFGGTGQPSAPFYLAALLYRDHLHGALLALLGLPALLRATGRTAVVRAAAMAFAAMLGLVVLSLPAQKDPRYALTVLPLAYGFTALSLDALLSDAHGHRHADAAVARVTATLAGVALVVAAIQRWALPAPSASSAPHMALVAAAGVVAWVWERAPRRISLALGGLCVVGSLWWLLGSH